VGVREAIAVVARAQRALVAEPMVKGELSTRLTAELPAAYGSWCQGCGVTHVPESLFRLAAFFGGLELEPGTSPPVLRRIPDWPRRPAGVASDPDGAPAHLQVVRGCLRLLGPATPAEVAGFLDTTATVIKEHWPDDAVEVRVEGTRKWLVGELLEPRPAVRLLGVGLALNLLGALGVLVSVVSGAGLVPLLVSLWVMVSSVGMVFPSATTIALADYPHQAGRASSLLGLGQYIAGALAAPLVGLGGEETAVPLGLVVVGASLLAALVFWRLVLRSLHDREIPA
jgi:hypothetical protein